MKKEPLKLGVSISRPRTCVVRKYWSNVGWLASSCCSLKAAMSPKAQSTHFNDDLQLVSETIEQVLF
jgi:hypothetical protein